jgi:hypothetical protein
LRSNYRRDVINRFALISPLSAATATVLTPKSLLAIGRVSLTVSIPWTGLCRAIRDDTD